MMEAMEAQLLERLEKLDGIADRVVDLTSKIDSQSGRLDQMQVKVDLSMEKLGKLEEEQIEMMKVVQQQDVLSPGRPPPIQVPPGTRDSILGNRPATAP